MTKLKQCLVVSVTMFQPRVCPGNESFVTMNYQGLTGLFREKSRDT